MHSRRRDAEAVKSRGASAPSRRATSSRLRGALWCCAAQPDGHRFRRPQASRVHAARPRHRCSGADVPCALRLPSPPFSGEVVTLAGHQNRVCGRGGGARRPHHHRLERQDRQGVARRRVRAHHPGARTTSMAVAMLPGGARFVSGSDDGTAKLWTLDGALERTFEVGNLRVVRRGAARRRALCGRPWHGERRGPAVPRRRDARPHLQGAHRRGARGGGDARRPAHHQRLG